MNDSSEFLNKTFHAYQLCYANKKQLTAVVKAVIPTQEAGVFTRRFKLRVFQLLMYFSVIKENEWIRCDHEYINLFTCK